MENCLNLVCSPIVIAGYRIFFVQTVYVPRFPMKEYSWPIYTESLGFQYFFFSVLIAQSPGGGGGVSLGPIYPDRS